MSIVCAYCGRPLERLNSIESEVGENLHEKTEYMCTNIRCQFASRIFYESRWPHRKQGYITVPMLQKKDPPKSWFRKLFGTPVEQYRAEQGVALRGLPHGSPRKAKRDAGQPATTFSVQTR